MLPDSGCQEAETWGRHWDQPGNQVPQVPAGQALHFPLSCSIDHTGFDRTSYCTGYHALQHKCQSNRVAGRQDKRLQHVRPDPAPHQIRHEAHQLEECKEGYRPEVRLISAGPELKICRLQVGGDVSARAVVAQSSAVQDEKARAQGLPAHHPRCLGQVRRGRGEETFRILEIILCRRTDFHFQLLYQGDQQQQAGQISPTPSPAGSEGSNCSKVPKI